MNPVLVIANPISGRGRGARVVPRIERRLRDLGHEVDVVFTAKRGDAKAATARAGDFSAVLAVGGDGTVNEIVNGLPENPPPLAQMPIGTANVLAKAFDLPRHPIHAADAVHAAHTVTVDAGTANGRKFLLMASAGFDAHVVHHFDLARKGAIRMADYVTWSLRTLFTYIPPVFRVTADGEKLPDASFVLVSNVGAYGGPLCFSRHAKSDDGALDLLVYSSWGRHNVVRLFAEAFAGDPATMQGALSLRVKSLRIEADAPLPWQVDGDPGECLPLEIGIVPKAIRLIVPG